MDKSEQIVYIVDDDKSVVDSTSLLLRSHGYKAQSFLDPAAFLDSYKPNFSGCLLLDMNMPTMGGLEVQSELLAIGAHLPIIIITGYADVPTAVQSLKAGAFEYLQKPYDSEVLLRCVRNALQFDAENRSNQKKQQSVIERMNQLTEREREVLEYLIEGHASKTIAIDLNLSQRTIDIYRSNVMQKMQTRSLAQLVKMVTEARLNPTPGAVNQKYTH